MLSLPAECAIVVLLSTAKGVTLRSRVLGKFTHTHTGTLPSPEIPLSDLLGILLSRFTESGMKRWFYKRGVARQERNAPGYRADPSSLQNKGQGEGYEAYQSPQYQQTEATKQNNKTTPVRQPCSDSTVA